MKKTLITAACIALASVASAQKGTGGSGAILEVGDGNAASGGIGATVVGSDYNPTNGTTDLVVDISGTESWDGALDPSNTILNVGIPGSAVTGIGWDVTVATVGASWLSEAVMSFQGEINLTVGLGDDFAGTASYDSGGAVVVFADIPLPDIIIAGGSMPVEFFESFDDVADAVDAVFTSGSITVRYEGGAAVPTVSEWGLIILTAMLLLGVVMMSLKSRNQPVTA